MINNNIPRYLVLTFGWGRYSANGKVLMAHGCVVHNALE